MMYLFVLLLALLFLVGIYLIDHELALAGWIWLGLSVLMGIGVYRVPYLQVKKSFKNTPRSCGEIVLTINDEGVGAAFPTGRSQVNWAGFLEHKETETLFLLFYSPGRYTIVPKRVMSKEQVKELRELLKRKLAKVNPSGPTS